METFSIILAVVLGLPSVAALGLAGVQWYRERQRVKRWQAEAYTGFVETQNEQAARALLAWCDARQAESRLGVSRSADREVYLRERPNYIAPERFRREAFRFMLGRDRDAEAAAGSGGFTSVHLVLNDGAGHAFRVERKLCLN